MATYKEIQAYVQRRYGFQPKACWIAHVKEMAGLPLRKAWNRKGDGREEPCPPDKAYAILAALRYFHMMR